MNAQIQKGSKMTDSIEPLSKAQPDVDTRAWEFLINTSKVSYDIMAVFTSGTMPASSTSRGRNRR
jgi:hypothetical protein